MEIYKINLKEIKKDFTIEAEIVVCDEYFITKKFSLRGVDVPSIKSKKGQAFHAHLMDVFDSVPFVVVKMYENDEFLRKSAEFFYLPDENDLCVIVSQGRCLNQELIDLELGQPHDISKRAIDFSEKTIKVKNEEIELVTGNFKAEIGMYISDCKQYLRAALENKPVDMLKSEFPLTDEEFLIIYGLKELKGMCMRVARLKPFNWQGN